MTAKTDRFPWRETPLRDEVTNQIVREIIVPGLDGREVPVVIPNEARPSEALREIRKFTTRLPPNDEDAKNTISTLRKLARPAQVLARIPGWKPVRGEGVSHAAIEAFVTPAMVIGFEGSGYRWHGPSQAGASQIGSVRGSLAMWRLVYGEFAERSNPIAFGIGAALAAPVRAFAQVPESPVFGFSGDSTVGKSSAVRTAAAVQGFPDAISDFDQTPRGLEETASDHNHLLCVFDAAEKSPANKRRVVLSRMTHLVAEGESMVRSRGVSDRYPRLKWEGVTLATSNASARQMAAELNLSWLDQEEVRFIDIPVLSKEYGGIFDRPKPGRRTPAEQAHGLIRKLQAALKELYGAPLEPWIRFLASRDPTPLVQAYMNRFLVKCEAPSGIEGRIAAKFALIYAALKIANEDANLLRWPKRLPLEAVMTLYRRSCEARLGRGDRPRCIEAFARLVTDQKVVRRARAGQTVRVRRDNDLLGVRCRHNDRPVLGLRLRGLRHHMPNDHRTLVAWMVREAVIVRGHGRRSTGQLPVTIKVGKDVLKKPRFLIVDRRKLRRALVGTERRAAP